jgi:hypothetical protein
LTGDRWAACLGRASLEPLEGSVLRLVESQEQIATVRLVGSLAEQAVLEDLLESSKPRLPSSRDDLHYLLATPFRYPPLRYGSRFGRRTEPSLFYASRQLGALLAEGAYYRFVFWYGMQVPPAKPLTTQHSVFGARITTARGLRLQHPPFDEHRALLTHRSEYSETQVLGTLMRDGGVEAFEFVSARDPESGINVALFTPTALATREPEFVQPWLCETNGETVRYDSRTQERAWTFELATFEVDGRLPAPAIL